MDKTRGKTLVGVLGGLVSGLALMSGTFAVIRTFRTPAPRPQTAGRVRVSIRASVPSAQIRVDGEHCGSGTCEVDLKAGPHQAEAQKPGYAGETREFVAAPGASLELNLRPLPPVLEVVSDVAGGMLVLDKQKPVPLAGGSAQLADIEPGEHKLRFTNGAFQADFQFESQPGAPPRLLATPAVRGLRAIVVAGAGPVGRVWVTDKDAELSIGARELGLIPAEGLALPAMERGAHRFMLKPARGTPLSFVYEIAESPTAWISLRTNSRMGTVRVSATNGDEAKVIVDGKDSGIRVRGGRALLLVPPGNHEVSIEKAGFLRPGEQRCSVKEAGETELEFRLQPVPTRALLPISGAPPGTAFMIDGQPGGTAGSDGSASLGDLTPGAHVVTARRDGYLPGRWEVKLGAGTNSTLRTPLVRAPARVRIAVQPVGSDATITIRRLGEFDERLVKEPVLTVGEGEYTVTAADQQGQRVFVRVRAEAGREALATLTLRAPPKAAPAAVNKEMTLEDWERTPGWSRQGELVVREGGGIVLAPTLASAVAVTFRAHVRPGKALRWVTQFRDRANFTLYEIAGGRLERADWVNDKKIPRNQANFSGEAKDSVRIRMEQQGTVIRTSTFLGGQWVDLDTADSTNGTGRFGFYLPGRERVALSEFRYEYR